MNNEIKTILKASTAQVGLETKLHYKKEIFMMNQQELFEYKDIWADNLKNNYNLLNKQKKIDSLLVDQKWKDMECVVVGAGPSLDFDIDALKKYRKNFKIICIDAALYSLYKYNIKPDFVFFKNTFQESLDLISGFPTKEFKAISNMFQSPDFFKKWQGSHYLYIPYDEDNFSGHVLNQFQEIPKILKKPSTFAMATIMARCMNFKRFYLVGGDYCFNNPDNYYCSNILYKNKSFDKSEVLKIENVLMDETYTTKNMFYNSEDLMRLLAIETFDQFYNCSINSILYNINWMYFHEIMKYKEEKKRSIFEFGSISMNASSKEVEMANRATMNYYRATMSKSMFDNQERFKKESTIKELFDKKEEFKNKRCIVCGAGPSLNENIELIKKYRGEFVVFAVDASCIPLYNGGVEPDYVLTIDPCDLSYFLKGYEGKNSIMLSSVVAHKNVVDSWKNKIYFFYTIPIEPFELWLLNVIDGYSKLQFITPLNNCGSTTILLVHQLGFKDILITGIDFSFPRNRMYTEGVNSIYAALDDSEKLKSGMKDLISVRDCHGNEVFTNQQFNFYARSLDQVIDSYGIKNITNIGGGILKIPYMNFQDYINAKILN